MSHVQHFVFTLCHLSVFIKKKYSEMKKESHGFSLFWYHFSEESKCEMMTYDY